MKIKVLASQQYKFEKNESSCLNKIVSGNNDYSIVTGNHFGESGTLTSAELIMNFIIFYKYFRIRGIVCV